MSANSETLVRLDGVRKVFYTDEVETHALSGIHLDIKKGEYISMAGPSGCGKSTLLSILGLLDSPTDGESVMNLLRELHAGGATICMVTHDPRYARYADRTFHLFDGQVVEETHEPKAEEELEESGFKL